MKPKLRVILEIVGGVIAAAAVTVSLIQFHYQKSHDRQIADQEASDREHNSIVSIISAETEARKLSDGQIIDAMKQSQQDTNDAIKELTRAVNKNATTSSAMLAELRIVMAKIGLDGSFGEGQ